MRSLAISAVAGMLLLTVERGGGPTSAFGAGGSGAQTITYAPSTEDFANPERGFTTSRSPPEVPITWDPCGVGDNFTAYDATVWTAAPSLDDLAADRARGRSVVSMYYHIAEFRDAPLSDAFLTRLDQDFARARAAGFKIAPRFAYNLFTGGPDAPLSRVLGHLDQLAPVLRRNVDVLAYVELGFIGCWGEMHTSSNGLIGDSLNDATRAILLKAFEVVPQERMIAVRYPRYKFQFFGNEDFTPIAPLTDAEAFDGSIRARWGQHDDCLVCGEWNWGTWWSPLNDAPAVRAFLHDDNRYVVQTGQPGEPGVPQPPDVDADGFTSAYDSCARVLEIFENEHWSAIDGGYSADGVHTAEWNWKRDGCFDDIARHLGYRFRLESATLPRVVRRDGALGLGLVLHNDGWAAPYNFRPVELVLRSQRTGAVTRVPVAADPRRWLPGRVTLSIDAALPTDLAPGRYDLLLALPDAAASLHDRPEYAIRFANDGTWDGDCGCNALNAAVTVSRLNHFQCYETRPPQASLAPRDLTLADAFGTSAVTVRNVSALCAPADKNGEEPGAENDPEHLANYGIKPAVRFTRRTGERVSNQFGTLTLDVLKPARLLVPTTRSPGGPAGSPTDALLDHFQCYKVRPAKGAARFERVDGVQVRTQFEETTIGLVKPLRLCVPVDKNGEGIANVQERLVCYRMRGTSGLGTVSVSGNNQFGPQRYTLSGQRREFCVPSTSVLATTCPELIVNGGFDLPVASNTTDSNGWSSANLDTVGGWKPTDGNPGAHFTLNQAGQFFTDPTLMQGVADLTVGRTYRLAGEYRSYAPYNGNPAKLDAFAVVVQPQPLDHASTLVLALPRPDPETAWTPFAVEFVPSSSDATVSFIAERMGDDSSFDVDNLSLVGPLTELCR